MVAASSIASSSCRDEWNRAAAPEWRSSLGPDIGARTPQSRRARAFFAIPLWCRGPARNNAKSSCAKLGDVRPAMVFFDQSGPNLSGPAAGIPAVLRTASANQPRYRVETRIDHGNLKMRCGSLDPVNWAVYPQASRISSALARSCLRISRSGRKTLSKTSRRKRPSARMGPLKRRRALHFH